jgi:hypothetical protein
MDWRELFLSKDTVQNMRLDELGDELTSTRLRAGTAARSAAALRQDVGLLILLQMVTLRTLMEKGLLGREELHAKLMELDRLDGIGDGKVSAEALKRVLGLWISGGDEGQGPSQGR